MRESFIHVFHFPLAESLKSDTIENCKNIFMDIRVKMRPKMMILYKATPRVITV